MVAMKPPCPTGAPQYFSNLTGLDCMPPVDHPIYALPVRVSRYRDHLERVILAWADDFGLLETPAQRQRLAATRLGDLIMRTYPYVRPDRLEALAGWFTWAFVIDDWYDGPGAAAGADEAAVARVLTALPLDGPGAAAYPTALVRQLAAVWEPIRAAQSLPWRLRFVDSMAAFLESFAYEAINRRERHTPAVLPYTQLRRHSGGITPCLHLLEYAAGLELPGLVQRSDPLRRMFDRAADVVVWVNDVLSLRKELAIGEVTNGVLALAVEQRLELPDAIAEVYRRVALDIEEFHCAEADLARMCAGWRGLTERDELAVRVYVAGMKCWMRGNLDWSLRSDRYRRADALRLCTTPTLMVVE